MNFRWILMKFLVNWYGFHIVTDNLISSGDRDKGVSITISIVGWTIAMGLRISTNTSNSNSRLSNNSNWLSNTDGVRHSSGDCVTCGHWLWHTNCLWDSSGDGVTFLSCDRAALGD